MRVHVHHLVRVQPGVGEHRLDSGDDAAPARLRLGDVVRVGRITRTGRNGEHLGAALPRVLLGLEYEHARALAEHEAVPALVERARCALRLVVAGGQRPHGGERGDVQRDDRRLGPAGQHHVGPAQPDHVDRVADGLGTRRAGAHRGVHPGARSEFDPDPPRRAVRHEHRDRERGQSLPAAVAQRVVGGEDGGDPADAAGHDHAEPLRRHLGRARGRPRLPGRDDRELLAPVEPPRLDAVEHRGRLDRGRRGDPGRQARVLLVG